MDSEFKWNPYITIPGNVDWAAAVDRFNDEQRSLANEPYAGSRHSCRLCGCDEPDRGCSPSGDCFHCILDMQFHDSGVGIYPVVKRKSFAKYAADLGYTITRKGYECGGSRKNPLKGVTKL